MNAVQLRTLKHKRLQVPRSERAPSSPISTPDPHGQLSLTGGSPHHLRSLPHVGLNEVAVGGKQAAPAWAPWL